MPGSATVTDEDRFTVAGIIRHLSAAQPDHEMLVLGDERRTWGGEFEVACKVAQAARRDGLGVGDRVAFLDRNGIAYFDFLFGGSLIGAVNVAVNWRLAPAEMAAIIDDSRAPRAGDPHRLPGRARRHARRPTLRPPHRRHRGRGRVAV